MRGRRCEFQFQDLPGVAGGRLTGVPRHSINAIIEGLLWNRLVWDSGPGEDGRGGASIIVYRDDAARLRCFFHERPAHDGAPDRFILKESQVFTTKTQVRAWLRQWHPRLQANPAAEPKDMAA